MVSMKLPAALVIIALTQGLQLTLAQNVTDCTDIAADLNTMSIEPVTVPDLPVCVDQRGGPQCCSIQYILDQLNATEENFLEGLRIELQERFQNFEDIVERLRAFLEGDFLNSYFQSLGNFNRFLTGGNTLLNGLLANLRNRLDFTPGDDDEEEEETATVVTATAAVTTTGGGASAIASAVARGRGNGFSVRGLLGNVVSSVASATANQYARQSIAATQCISQVIQEQVQMQKMEAQAEALQQIRRVAASIDNLREFIRNLTDNLAGFRPLQQCINALVSLNTCGRCVSVRPPFCQNVCAAIASACYSPINDALEDQLEVLWEVVRRILEAATDAIGDLNANRGIFNLTEIAAAVSANCTININLRGSRGPRQAEDDEEEDDVEIPLLPAVIRTAANALRGGPFNYNGRRARGPGLCRLLNTSRANCWNGNANVTDDIDEFDGDDIEDQVNNPVINITQEDLTQQAVSLGTPVSTALNSTSFAQIAPLGLVIPDGDGQTPGDNNGGQPGGGIPGIDGNNGAAAMFVTFTSLITLVFASVFVA